MSVFLPFVANDSPIVGQSEPSGPAAELFALMKGDPGQKRAQCIWSDKLAQVAYSHCADMAKRDYFSHETPEHIWPNKRVRDAGYRLPDFFPDDANFVESIAAGQPIAAGAWSAWLESDSHKTHALGLTPFFSSETNVGIGFYYLPHSHFWWYWCLISCPPEIS